MNWRWRPTRNANVVPRDAAVVVTARHVGRQRRLGRASMAQAVEAGLARPQLTVRMAADDGVDEQRVAIAVASKQRQGEAGKM